ncbi:MAG TPA: YbhB/YbcL family Raf kinase inhibitor-like protein [Polyangiaceae bacterium]|jgi:hypothetical protein
MRSVHAGADKLLARKVSATTAARLTVTSPDFADGAPLPISCTVDGAGTPPALQWAAPPTATQSLVVVCEDPDAPLPEPFVHWIVYGIPPAARTIDASVIARYGQGQNSKLANAFAPPSPPPGHGVHHYHFQVFALDAPFDGEASVGRRTLVNRLKGHVLAWGEIVGTYERP